MVQVTIEISEKAGTALARQARDKGCSLEDLVKAVVERAAGIGSSAVDPTLVADIHRIAGQHRSPNPPLEWPAWSDEEWESDPFQKLADMISEEEVVEGSPTDLAAQHDHYLYGHAKRFDS